MKCSSILPLFFCSDEAAPNATAAAALAQNTSEQTKSEEIERKIGKQTKETN